jgi:5-methylcytosine-specific restriction endonuclease McrA
MTLFSDEVRDAVVARAGARCEYCHLPTRGQVATFPIDHVLPRSRGGETILDNLALASGRTHFSLPIIGSHLRTSSKKAISRGAS